MRDFTATDLDALVERGCSECSGKRFTFRTYVAEVLAVQGGEPVGKAKWAYDGEAFLEGVYEVVCDDCKRRTGSTDCPLCHASGGLSRALESENDYPAPEACIGCGASDLGYFAFVPAEVAWHGQKSDKAKTSTAPDDPGFHGFRSDCRACGKSSKREHGCPLCGSRAAEPDAAT